MTLHLRARYRAQVVVGRVHDAAGATSTATGFRATIDWGDGTAWRGVALRRAGGSVEIRSRKRYATRGVYRITVTLSDRTNRTSVARSSAVVRRATRSS